MKELCILSPNGILGYGFPSESLEIAIENKPDLIAVDAGSTDPGPYYLGSGIPFVKKRAVKRDLTLLMRAAKQLGVPLVIGSAGGSGARPHVDWTVGIVKEIMEETGIRMDTAVIDAEIDNRWIMLQHSLGRIGPVDGGPPFSPEAMEGTERVVGQMGIRPFQAALAAGAQLVIGGRAYDPAVFAAYPVSLGYDMALSHHLGKILECGCMASYPGSASDCMLGWLGEESFRVKPASANRRCTVESVAAHTLYEKSDPVHLYGPDGMMDLSQTEFIQMDDGSVRVRGSRFVIPAQSTLKLEGARRLGYRSICIAATRDPIMIGQIEQICAAVTEQVFSLFSEWNGIGAISRPTLHFRLYGKDGVMGALEPERKMSHELCILIESVAVSREDAALVTATARSLLLHYGYEGRVSTSGNLALPFSPSEFDAGEVYEFSVYHLLHPDKDESLFQFKIL